MAQDDTSVKIGEFSQAPVGGRPIGWRPLIFPHIKAQTKYQLVRDDGRTVMRADANASASGYITDVSLEVHEYPLIRWRWKISNLVAGADMTRKDGDDYPARVYVNFRAGTEKLDFVERIQATLYRRFYGKDLPTAALNYVWDGKAPVDTIVPNAYTRHVRMIVVHSGSRDVGRWVEEERNLLEDYRAAFGEDPPPLSSIAIMTDTDNTGGHATAWYGDISLNKIGPQ